MNTQPNNSVKSNSIITKKSPSSESDSQVHVHVQPQAPTAKPSFGRSIQKTLGFQRHEFVCWSLCSTAMGLFVLASVRFLHPPTFKGSSIPGEWYYFEKNPYHFGIFLHLATVLPAGFLVILQFIPAIRNKAVYIHTYMGYAIMTLLTLGNAGALIITPTTLGGNDLSHITANLFLVVTTSVSMYFAWYHIRRQQIDGHRKWILRAMSWMSVIVTMRIVFAPIMILVSFIGGYTTLWTCDEVLYIIQDTEALYEDFPACRLGLQTYVGVPAGMDSPLHMGSLVRLTFAMSTWLAIAIHTLLTEVYIQRTPKEDERLKKISYRKQLALGLLPARSVTLSNAEDITSPSDKL